MNYELKRKKYKKHLMELEFLRAEISFQEGVLVTAHQEFDIWHRSWCEKNNINLQELNKKHKSKVSKILSRPNFPDFKHDEQGILVLKNTTLVEEKLKFSKIYKQIVRLTHPDKNQGNALDFKTASRAYEIGDWSMLVQIAEKYNIFPDDLDELIPMMMEEAIKLKKTIKNNKDSYSWKFQECETEQCKEQLVKQFLKQLFNLEL